MSSSSGCGIFGLSPRWLQKYATTRCFLVVYGLLGTTQAMGYLYFVVTLTTIEKRFKIPSQTTGIILSGNEVSQILLSLFLSYFGGQRNRPRWMAWGVVFCSLSCFILAWPHFLYGAGDEALRLTKEYVTEHYSNITILAGESNDPKNSQLCRLNDKPTNDCETGEIFSYVPLVLIFLSQFVLGIGNTMYYSLGQSYLDDNTKKGNTPLVLAYALSLRMFGPILGFFLGYVSLNFYIDPTKTPLIDNTDPRWLGAWWAGWVLLGIMMLLFAVLIGMFPKALPKTLPKKCSEKIVKSEKELEATKENALDTIRSSRLSLDGDIIGNVSDVPKLKDLPTALLRLLRNKMLMFNILANIFFILGSSGYMTFLTKYLEVQFSKTASEGTIITGPVTIVGMTIGFILSGYIISKYRPAPKYLFFWNVILGLFTMGGQFTYMFLQCDVIDTLQTDTNFTINMACNADCYCERMTYSPVCDANTGITYFSPCHAGCSKWNKTMESFTQCQCGTQSSERFSVNKWQQKNATLDVTHGFVIDETTHSVNFDMDAEANINDKDVVYDDSQEYTSTQKNLIRSKRETGKTFRNHKDTDNPLDYLSNMVPGSCGQNCQTAFKIFTLVSLLINLFGATGKIGNILLNFRAVDQKDKAFAQGLSLMMVSLLALIPGPIIYGIVIDATCTVWNNQCGVRGNCQLYDQAKFRYYVNLLSLALTSVGMVLDLAVWHYSKNLKLYDDEEVDNDNLGKKIKKEFNSSELDKQHIQPLLNQQEKA